MVQRNRSRRTAAAKCSAISRILISLLRPPSHRRCCRLYRARTDRKGAANRNRDVDRRDGDRRPRGWPNTLRRASAATARKCRGDELCPTRLSNARTINTWRSGSNSEEQWPGLCRALKLDDLISDPRFSTNLCRVTKPRRSRPSSRIASKPNRGLVGDSPDERKSTQWTFPEASTNCAIIRRSSPTDNIARLKRPTGAASSVDGCRGVSIVPRGAHPGRRQAGRAHRGGARRTRHRRRSRALDDAK